MDPGVGERARLLAMAAETAIAQRLAAEIRASGPIPFARFMEEALYAADGYYASPSDRIGRRGDFVTGSSLSPLFSRCTTRLLERLDGALGSKAAMLEVGIGSGAHVTEVAQRSEGRELIGVDRMPDAVGLEGFERLASVSTVADRSVTGLVFSYELFDAYPVHRLVQRETGIGELLVDFTDSDGFAWVESEPSDPALSGLIGRELEPGQVADLSPAWRTGYAELAAKLDRGLIVTCDYGFERDQLFDSRIRKHGTLACYREHRVHRDPFVAIGKQDLTAHVDFSTLREVGEAAGLETIAFTRQARWLTACGLFEELERADQRTRLDAMHLLDGAGMGDEIRVLVQSRGISPTGVLDVTLL